MSPVRLGERRTARGSQGAVAREEPVAEELVPKNRGCTEVRPVNAEAFAVTRYRTLPFSLENERGSCDAAKGIEVSLLKASNTGRSPNSVSPGQARVRDFRSSLTRS